MLKTPHLLAAGLSFTLAFVFPPNGFGQGNLTPPPGPPAPTMKTLDQVEARTIVNAANTPGDAANSFIISAPGSYYLTGNIIGDAGKHGISIQTNDVTLDLNGFALVNVPAAQTNLCVRNGTVRGWPDGGVRTDVAISTLVEKLRLSENAGATGLALGNGSAKDCMASGNSTGFVLGNGAEIKDCTATGNTIGFSTGDRAMVSSCIATVNTGVGFYGTSYLNILDCTASRNGASGFYVQATCSLIRCSATRNGPFGQGYGIKTGEGCTIADCTSGANGIDGISVYSGSTVRGCTVRANEAHGILASTGGCHVTSNTCEANQWGIEVSGDRNRVERNSCTLNTTLGYLISGSHNLIIGNSASGNSGSYSIPAGNAAGPIVDMTAGGTISSTSPWANFSH